MSQLTVIAQIMDAGVNKRLIDFIVDELSEWLRSLTRNQVLSQRKSSNLLLVVNLFCFALLRVPFFVFAAFVACCVHFVYCGVCYVCSGDCISLSDACFKWLS